MLLFALLAATFTQEFIYETAPFPQCHASTIVESAPGEFLAAWFGGTKEGAKDVAIWAARRQKDGTWSEPYELIREPDIATYNPVLFKTDDGRLWLYYRFGPHPSTWTSARRYSRDGGKTWSTTEYLPSGQHGPIKNKPLVLKNGVVLAGTSSESYQAWASWIDRSTDHGHTWPTRQALIYPAEPRYGSIQPTIVTLGQNLRAFVRTTNKINKILYADSKDGGQTWTELKDTGLPNPNSGIDAVTLRDGRVLIVYNHTTKGRSPLNLAVTRTGETWKPVNTLESEPGEFSYPAIIQATDGSVHVTYTWNRRRVRHVVIKLSDIPQ